MLFFSYSEPSFEILDTFYETLCVYNGAGYLQGTTFKFGKLTLSSLLNNTSPKTLSDASSSEQNQQIHQ